MVLYPHVYWLNPRCLMVKNTHFYHSAWVASCSTHKVGDRSLQLWFQGSVTLRSLGHSAKSSMFIGLFHDSPLDFPWFATGFPMMFLGFPMFFIGFPMMFHWISHDFHRISHDPPLEHPPAAVWHPHDGTPRRRPPVHGRRPPSAAAPSDWRPPAYEGTWRHVFFYEISSMNDSSTIMTGWWLGHPSEKYESQLGWLATQYMGQ